MPLSFSDLSEEDQAALLKEAELLAKLNEREVTSSEDWKSPRKAGFLIELPSGNVARIRRTMNLLELVKSGQIPNPLGKIVEGMISRGEVGINMQTLDMEARIQALDMVDAAVVAAMVEPRVIIPPEGVNPEVFQTPPGAISIMDLTNEDKIFITQVAQGGTADVEKFREEQSRLMESLRFGTDKPVPPKQLARAKRAGSSSKRK
jgi:hypothetical protein